MLFALVCTDKPNSLELRLATRTAHLAYLETYQSKLATAGALADADGRARGSLLIIDVADAAEAAGFAEADPYARAGLFESVVIRPYRQVFKDGELVA
jgi:uncharacterized protein YciI